MKFGIIDEIHMNSIGSAVNEFNDMKKSLDILISEGERVQPVPFLAEITTKNDMTKLDIERSSGVEEEVTVSWYYEWKTLEVANADIAVAVSFADPETAFTNTDIATSTGIPNSGYCFNLAELANTATYDEDGTIFGVNVSSESYPAGFIPVGIPEKSIVMLTRLVSSSGQVLYVFDRQGTHDGECPS